MNLLVSGSYFVKRVKSFNDNILIKACRLPNIVFKIPFQILRYTYTIHALKYNIRFFYSRNLCFENTDKLDEKE